MRLLGGVSADVYRVDLKLISGDTKSIVIRAHGASHCGLPAKLEYRLLKALYLSGLPVPLPLFVDVSNSILSMPY